MVVLVLYLESEVYMESFIAFAVTAVALLSLFLAFVFFAVLRDLLTMSEGDMYDELRFDSRTRRLVEHRDDKNL